MALGVLARFGLVSPNVGPGSTAPCSSQIQGPWVTIHGDLKATASTNTTTPLADTSSNVKPAMVPMGATRVRIRVKRGVDATVTTQPIVRVWGVGGPITSTNVSTTIANDGTVAAWRLDRNGNGAGVTVTMDATNDMADSLYRYSPVPPHTDEATPYFDCYGAQYIMALVEQAYAGDGASGTVVLEASFIS